MTDTLASDIFASSEDETLNPFDNEDNPPENVYKEDGKPPPDKYAKRTSGEDLIGGALAIAGTTLVNRKIDPPVGRVIQLESPIAGRKIDEFIANTWIDKLLQPLFRKGTDLEGLGAIIGLPILVGIFERRPEMAPVLSAPMVELMGLMLEQLGPLNKRKKAARRRAFTRNDLANMLGIEVEDIPRDMEPAEFMLRSFVFQDAGGVPEEDA